jgi:putative transposase
MARIARVVVPGCAYHVTHRGNRRGEIFLREGDRDLYRKLLQEYAARHELEVRAYCWMSNHVHLVVVGHRPDSLARTIGIAHRRYARILNRRNDWTGHLWANRFYSTLLDDLHLKHAVRYVELNPVRAGLTIAAEDYAWSSARSRILGIEDPLLSTRPPFAEAIDDWRAWLGQGVDVDLLETLRVHTATGRPCGSPEFVRALEKHLGRRLRPHTPGRPSGPAEENPTGDS